MPLGFLVPTFRALNDAGWKWNRKERRWEHTSGRTAKNVDDAYRVQREISKAEVQYGGE